MTDFVTHHAPGSNTIVFAFASGNQDHFEWGGTLERLGVSYVLIRDSKRHWYSSGVEGWGDFRASIRRVNALAEPYERTIALGLSSGSYGALLYGAYAPLDEVIAISPITGKDTDVHDDIPRQYHHRVAHVDGDPWWPDLKAVYRIRPPVYVRAYISDGRGTEVDLHMAKRLGRIDLTLIPGHSHDGLGAHLRDTGIIEMVINGDGR